MMDEAKKSEKAPPDHPSVDTETDAKLQHSDTAQLKPTIDLFGAIMLLVGSMIGSGIFISPTGVYKDAGSVGFSLIIWISCGIFSMLGAYWYSELGTFITKSGGDYAYVMVAFGPFVGFMRMWVEVIVNRPLTMTAVALTFALYILSPFFPTCDPPRGTTQLTAAGCLEYLEPFENLFEGTVKSPGRIWMAFYSGLWAFNGWQFLNFVTEEVKNPVRTLRIAIVLSCLLCTIIYAFTNVAFYAGVTERELELPAVAFSFANCFYGTVNGTLLSSARLPYVAACENHLPAILCFISPRFETPMPAVLMTGLLSLLYLFLSNSVFVLINYITVLNWLAISVATLGLIYLRFKMPPSKFKRPIKVNLVFPILFFLGCVFLVIFPIIQEPGQTLIGVALMLTSIPIYFIFIWWKKKPKCFSTLPISATIFLQKLLLVVPPPEAIGNKQT